MKYLPIIFILLFTLLIPQSVNIPVVIADEPEPVELINDRTATTKLWSLGNNQYHLESWINAVHYQTWSQGEWLDIDPDYFEDDSGNYTAIFLKLPYIVRMGDDSGRRIYPDRTDLTYWIEFYNNKIVLTNRFI